MTRPLFRLALSFALGVFGCHYLLPVSWQYGAAAAILVVGLILSWSLRGKRGEVILVSAGLALGVLWTGICTSMCLLPCEELAGQELMLTLELTEYPEDTAYGTRCVARADGIFGKVMYYGAEELQDLVPGDRLSGVVRCSSARLIGGKRSDAFISDGVFLRLYPSSDMVIERGEELPLRYFPQFLKNRISATVKEVFDDESEGLILALLTGERQALSEQSKADLEESGLMHLTAVSGLHCGFLIALLSLLVCRDPRLTAFIGYPILVIYIVMVGCTPSVVRAGIMVGFMLAASLLRRENDPPTSLASAAMFILAVNPFAVGSVSFQLSFAAVVGLFCVTPRVYAVLNAVMRWIPRGMRKLWAFLNGSISCSLGALALTVPLSAYYFRTVSLVAPLSNLLVLFMMPLLFACALIVTALCALIPAVAPIAIIPALLARYVLAVAGVVAKIPGHSVGVGGWMTVMWLVFVYGIFLIAAVSRDRQRKYAFAAVFAVLTLLVVRFIPREIVKDDRMTIVAVDAGQGAATLVHSGGATALVDCGSNYSERGVGASTADTMDVYGWKSLQYIVLTHLHRDHANGVGELLARTSAEKLLMPRDTESTLAREILALAERYCVAVEYIETNAVLALGDAVLTIYPPLTDGEANEDGLTILASCGEFDALITGDMSLSTERKLIKRYDLADIEVLFVGHHGSADSASEELIKTVMPEVGIISVGENSYGHPAPEAMKRLAFYGVKLYRTDWQGNILIQVHK